MQLRRTGRATSVFLALAMASVLAACGSSSSSSSSSSSAPAASGSTAAGGQASGTLNGSGSTLQLAYQQAAIEAYKAQREPHDQLRRRRLGQGPQDLADQVVDFAGSDAPYQGRRHAEGQGRRRPLLPGPARPDHGLATTSTASTSSSSSARRLAKIFQRDIKKWNDPAIAADNPGVELPDADIVVAHRSDCSGTTDNFTKFLDKASAGAWKLGSGSTVEWPADTQAGNGNGGVAQIVKSDEGRDRLRRPLGREGRGPEVREDQEPGRQVLEPTPDSASAAARRHRGQGRPHVHRASGRRATRRIRSPRRPGDRLREADRRDKAAALKAYFKYLRHRRPEAAARARLRAAAEASLTQAKAQIGKIAG